MSSPSFTVEDFDKKVDKLLSSPYGWQGNTRQQFIDLGTAKGQKLGHATITKASYVDEDGNRRTAYIPTASVGKEQVVTDMNPIYISSMQGAKDYALDAIRKYHQKEFAKKYKRT